MALGAHATTPGTVMALGQATGLQQCLSAWGQSDRLRTHPPSPDDHGQVQACLLGHRQAVAGLSPAAPAKDPEARLEETSPWPEWGRWFPAPPSHSGTRAPAESSLVTATSSCVAGATSRWYLGMETLRRGNGRDKGQQGPWLGHSNPWASSMLRWHHSSDRAAPQPW